MKEIIGKNKPFASSLPKQLLINKKLIFDKANIAENLNDFFVNVDTNLASKIPETSRSIESYLEKTRFLYV